MTKRNKEIVIKRLKSFGWRLGMMVLVAGIDFVLRNEGLIEPSPFVVVVLGLAGGELTKFLNSNR